MKADTMTEFDFLSDKQKIHFIGIGGISMSAIANVLIARGIQVTGSDFQESRILDDLRNKGATIFVGHREENISEDTTLVIHTAAIHEDNPELIKAKQIGIPTVPRADFLGWLMKNYETAVCISGTHGKTTTTSLVSQALVENGYDPTIMVGGIVPFLGGNLRIGNEKTFVTEACEYTNSFLSFFPTIGVILNVEADHLDFFKDLDDIRASFKRFSDLLPENGYLIINGEIDDLDFFIDDAKSNVLTFGINGQFDFTAKNISFDEFANPSFDVFKFGKNVGRLSLKIPGEHNIMNALAALSVAYVMGTDIYDAMISLEHFNGVERRFEILGEIQGVTVIDDYAHHPDEIRATLTAAKKYPHKKLWCVFQPHTYTRTKALLDEFAESLQLADAVVLPDIYAAREKNDGSVSSDDLRAMLGKLGKEAYYFPTFDEIENFLLENLSTGDLLITMGAGDVVLIGKNLLGK